MRYTLCFAPPAESPLWQMGCRWLGRDAVSGVLLPQPRFRGLDAELVAEMTRSPARAGFHAVLVPPFRLQTTVQEEDLVEALADFASRRQPLVVPALRLGQLDNFFCLRPERHHPELQVLSAHCIRWFDRFRAPLNPSEMARRKAALLNGQEKRNLELWGTPYVFEQFRFHFTLTGRMSEGRNKEQIHAALIEIFGPLVAEPLVIDSLCLFIEPLAGQPMRCLCRFPFATSAADPDLTIDHDQHFRQDLYPGYKCHPA